MSPYSGLNPLFDGFRPPELGRVYSFGVNFYPSLGHGWPRTADERIPAAVPEHDIGLAGFSSQTDGASCFFFLLRGFTRKATTSFPSDHFKSGLESKITVFHRSLFVSRIAKWAHRNLHNPDIALCPNPLWRFGSGSWDFTTVWERADFPLHPKKGSFVQRGQRPPRLGFPHA